MLQRIRHLVRGGLSRLLQGIERDHPEALLESEREDLRRQLARFTESLVSHAALCERLIQQVRKLEGEEDALAARARALLAAGDQRAAGEAALDLRTIRRELAENRAQAEDAERTYRELVRARDDAIETARRRYETLRRKIDDMRIQQAVAELNASAAGLLSSSGNETLGRLEAMIDDERARARARSRVARDEQDMRAVERNEAERAALAAAALADFAAAEGLPLAAAPTSESFDAVTDGTKAMGPLESEPGGGSERGGGDGA